MSQREEECGHPILETIGKMAVRIRTLERERDEARARVAELEQATAEHQIALAVGGRLAARVAELEQAERLRAAATVEWTVGRR